MNVRVHDKAAARSDADVQTAVQAVSDKLGDTGRVIVRESGTEPVIRVMVEAESQAECQQLCEGIVQVIREKGHAV